MRKKILVAVFLNVIIISVTLGIISSLTVRDSIRRSLDDRLKLARIIADYIDVSLQTNLNRLMDISLSGKIDLTYSNWESARKALETAYRYSLFTDGVFLLDRHGNILLTYPPQDVYGENLSYINYVSQVLSEGKPVISNVYTIDPIKKQVLFMMVPLKDRRDTIVGVAGGMLSPSRAFISTLLQRVKMEKSGYIDVIDSNEVVVASDYPARILSHDDNGGALSAMIRSTQSGIRSCSHVLPGAKGGETIKDILAFVPLKIAPWGVIVGQEEAAVFAPASSLKRHFLIIVAAFIATSLLFGIGAGTSIVRPLKALTAETNRIAAGDLSKEVGDLGSDEVLQLSKSFETMRIGLAASLDRIQRQNLELEHRVARRTEQIRKSQKKVESLLKKIFSTEEEERKRIARALHDEALQDMSAILINLDIYKARPESFSMQRCDELRAIVLKTIDDMHGMIQNLRPTVLDDLGLEAAIVWLLDKHLKTKGIAYKLEMNCPTDKRFSPKIERTLFLITQEAVINIARHAQARNVFVTLEADACKVSITVEDDGKGFELDEVLRASPESMRGLGILGMKERAGLFDAEFGIDSAPGKGTLISVCVPLDQEGGDYE
ncbi:MAG TPA: cache domain-containing protein [Dissulfurispiraceae bacterium]|nr:cache domain-containing protein [Dissulfurispiraceae bacterium]